MFRKKSSFGQKELHRMANAARLLALDAIQAAGSGHPGVALGFADVIATLYANHLDFDPLLGDWDNRDRAVLSMGHAAALLYAVLHLLGYPISRDKLKAYRKIGGLPGHPERNPKIGIEMTTGPLGQGFASAVGIAMARPENKVYVMASDGDLMEGVSMEAASLAGTRGLRNLIVMWDDNGITIDGKAETQDDIPAKFRAMGWGTIELDGMNPREIDRAIGRAKKMKSPVLLCCKTIIGYSSRHAGTEKVHGSPLAYDDAMRVMSNLSRDYEIGSSLWKKLADSKANAGKDRRSAAAQKVKSFEMPEIPTKDYSTRELFNIVMKSAVRKNPDIIVGGSADLSQSTGSFADNKNYIHYGVREHAMGAVMNGLAIGGLYPYGGTFLVFSDYMRPAIRQAALMGLPVLFVFSHDSIAVGGDGPTHQPVEQLPALRAIPNLNVFRPCNLTETFLCLKSHFAGGRPSAIILSRQAFGIVPEKLGAGISGYIVAGTKNAAVKLCATGSEVALALSVRDILESKKIKAAVISVVSAELFEHNLLWQGAGFKVWIEASSERPLGFDMAVGINGFGESGPGDEIYKKYGFDARRIAGEIIKKLG
jgi:transketolase